VATSESKDKEKTQTKKDTKPQNTDNNKKLEKK